MLERAIAEFGNRLKIQELSLDENGLLVLDIDNIGRLSLEISENGENLYLYLILPYPVRDDGMPRKVLELCSFHHAHPFPIRGGVHAGWVLLLTEFDVKKLDAATLENATRTLSSLLKTLFV